ncbi:MAG: FAD-binding protein [Clostridia bacterium]|jgi:flavin-dependent dehydrogenase|nr:FAD-binding protein [Clostridia bacterium]
MIYDYAIIGAGPAGSTIARLIDKTNNVIILDRRNLDQNEKWLSSKCCGGLIAPAAQKVLEKLELKIPNSVLVSPQLNTVKTIDSKIKKQNIYKKNYINIDREKYDRWMASIIPERVKKEYSAVFKGFKYENNIYEVFYYKDGETKKIKTNNIIGADGSISKVRSLIYPDEDRAVDKYIAMQKWYKSSDKIDHYLAVFNNNVTDFYSWMIPKGEYLVLGTAIKAKENIKANEKFVVLENFLEEKGFNLDGLIKKEGAFITRPTRSSNIKLGFENKFLIGEAAGFISPSSAEGFSYAFKSAIILADAINNKKEILKKYRRKAVSIKINILYKNIKSKIMYSYLLRKIIMELKIFAK